MPDATKIEFLRFGSSIPGAYWGCCAADIIQCFSGDPDAKSSIQMIEGDGGSPCTISGKQAFAGPTNRDIFYQRIRVGTFGTQDMPNHAFFAILTGWQIANANGKKWLQILRDCGFEFFRTVSNSVYAGASLAKYNGSGEGNSPNYIFVLVRNIGSGHIPDPYTPPKAWTDLSSTVPEVWKSIKDTKALAKDSHKAQTKCWEKIGPAKFLTEEEIVAAGAPVYMAAKRTSTPQQLKSSRTVTKATPSLKAPMPTVA